MLFDSKPYTFDRVFRLLASVAICVGIIWLMKYLSDILIPFAVSFLLAYLLNPLVNRIQHRVRYRTLAVFVTLGIVTGLFVLSGLLIIPIIKKEISHMSELLVRVSQDAGLTQRAVEYLPQGLWEKIQALVNVDEMQQISALLSQKDIWVLLQVIAENVLPGFWQVIQGAASFIFTLLGLFIVLLYLVFLLLDYHRIKNEWKDLIPPQWRGSMLGFINDFNKAMNQYFCAQALVASIVGVLFAFGFWLVGLPLAILLGLFIGLLNMVPYLQTIGLIPAGLLAVVRAIETGGNLWGLLGLTLLVFIIVQAIQDTILTPRIMAKGTGLSPAVILLSISVWGKLLGLLGLIIALPMTCLLLAYYRRLMVSLEQSQVTG